jgi:hypothetical protein
MPGGLINFVSYGVDDLFLTGAPQITMFKTVYRRHTNYSKESMVIPMNDIDFDKTVEVEIHHNGDLLSNTYIQLEIPKVHILKTDTVTDLTPEELAVLDTPYPVISQNGQPDFVSDLDLIKKFMMINMEGYRKAIKDANIKNQTVIQYITSILNVINAAATQPEIIQNYDIALTNALNWELQKLKDNKSKINELTTYYNMAIAKIGSNGDPDILFELEQEYETKVEIIEEQNDIIYKNISALDYKTSDISYILNTLLDAITNGSETILFGFIDPSTVTVQDVLNLLNNAVGESKNVLNYFFQNSQNVKAQKLDSESKYAKFAWVKKLGHAIIDYVEVNIGGERIDRHYGEWINIWYELTSSQYQVELYDKMIGNVPEMTTFDRNPKPAYTLYIPLSFWFCRRAGLAFPRLALQFNKFYITVKLRKLEEVAYIERLPTVDQNLNPVDFTDNALCLTDIWDNLQLHIFGNLLVDFVYLEQQERTRFARSAHEYLIETIEYNFFTNETDKKRLLDLNFTGPSKELIWVYQKVAYVNHCDCLCASNYNKLWTNYSIGTENETTVRSKNPIMGAKLQFNSYDRFYEPNREAARQYFNYVQPYQHHTRTPSDGINMYSFALFPEDHQPSGSCNFSRISYPTLSLLIDRRMFFYKLSDIDPEVIPGSPEDITLETECNASVYSVKYQVLRIINGMAGFAFN